MESTLHIWSAYTTSWVRSASEKVYTCSKAPSDSAYCDESTPTYKQTKKRRATLFDSINVFWISKYKKQMVALENFYAQMKTVQSDYCMLYNSRIFLRENETG